MADDEALAAFVEQLGLLWERYGANRTMGRMLGWLMVCEPAEQTAADLATSLQVSKASVSTATRQLEAAGLLERMTIAGDRRVRYRVRDRGWDATARARVAEMALLRDLAGQAEAALADEPPGRRQRVQEFADWAGWWHDEYATLLARRDGELARQQEER